MLDTSDLDSTLLTAGLVNRLSPAPDSFEYVSPYDVGGEPFFIRLNSAVRRKLAQLEQRGAIDVLVLKGVLVPQISLNPDRMEPGAFDNPRLIGPFAEFRFAVDASSLSRVPKERSRPG